MREVPTWENTNLGLLGFACKVPRCRNSHKPDNPTDIWQVLSLDMMVFTLVSRYLRYSMSCRNKCLTDIACSNRSRATSAWRTYPSLCAHMTGGLFPATPGLQLKAIIQPLGYCSSTNMAPNSDFHQPLAGLTCSQATLQTSPWIRACSNRIWKARTDHAT